MKLFVDNTGRFELVYESIAYYKEMGISLAIESMRQYGLNAWLLYSSSEKLIADIQKFHPNGIKLRRYSREHYDFKVLEIISDAILMEVIRFMVEHYDLELGEGE